MKGKDLEYMEYEQLMPFVEVTDKAFFVTCADYVTTEDGTGIVHTAPAFGEDDYNCGRKYQLPVIQPVDSNGKFTATPWEGHFVMEDGIDVEIIKWLAAEGKLFSKEKIEHNYPHCWRCGTPLVYYANPSWYIEMTKLRVHFGAINNSVIWYPNFVGEGRFGNWLENVKDWAVSRTRYWGTPLNVWRCDCGHTESIGSRAELAERAIENVDPKTVELHRPYVDDIHLKCDCCGKPMTRVPEVIDCWFDSGSLPFAQYHYPFENKEVFEKNFPADFISEAVDQTRGWFYSLLAISTLLFDKAPYKNVIVLGHIQDKDGQKMSKSKGNAVDPMDALRQHGADAIRWYFYSNSAPWLPNRFHDDAVKEGRSKFMGTLWNTYAFYVLYANIDNFNPMEHTLDYEKLSVMDKWILSKLNSTIQTCDSSLENYKIPETAKALQEFVDDLSNWYVRRSRERYWAKGMEQDKVNAYMTLYTCLTEIAKAAAPMIPFMTEEIYQNIVAKVDPSAPESIHLCDYPKANEAHVDKELEADMDLVLKVVVLGRACRNRGNMKNRQPLANMFVKAPFTLNEFFKDIIADELIIKAVTFTVDVRSFTTYTFKPQLRTVGPKYGKLLGKIRTALSSVDGNATMDELKANGSVTFDFDGEKVVLTEEDLLIDMTQKEGYVTESNQDVTVVLDCNLTPELLEEGFVREIISKIQTMRKEAGFEVTDHITVGYKDNVKIETIFSKYADEICADVLADKLTDSEISGYTKEWSINGETVVLTVSKE